LEAIPCLVFGIDNIFAIRHFYLHGAFILDDNWRCSQSIYLDFQSIRIIVFIGDNMAFDTKEFEIELEDGTEVTVEITMEAYVEKNYGADADGNRGEDLWFLDGPPQLEITDCRTVLSKEQRQELKDKIDSLVAKTDWNFEEDEREYQDD
jgi:hypothetical protein